MQFEMVMPKMGESITEGTILKWLKNEGDVVAVVVPGGERSLEIIEVQYI